jgi:hypothetical protein
MHPFRDGFIETCAVYSASLFILMLFIVALTIAVGSRHP